MEEGVQLKKLEIEGTDADTKAKEVALAIMSIDKDENVTAEKYLVREPAEGDVRPRRLELGETSAMDYGRSF